MRTFISLWDRVSGQRGSVVQCPSETEVICRFFQPRRNVHDVGFDANMLRAPSEDLSETFVTKEGELTTIAGCLSDAVLWMIVDRSLRILPIETGLVNAILSRDKNWTGRRQKSVALANPSSYARRIR